MQGTRVIGVGTDVASADDIAQSVGRFGDRYLARVFTAAEARQGAGAAGLAELFAAKEAVAKALAWPPATPLPWTDIEVHADHTPPTVRLHGRAADLGARRQITDISLSWARTGPIAVAVALATATPSTSHTPTLEGLT
ncbi:MAG: 4'-phosphopantetheinyl transferase superfamily protein [Micrococcales bacterium]|nr:4'-phosphopantetheinyl transferase superfamily protein [Micrococcales bacterium]